ncbi:MAG: hypothetical protein K2X87_23560, partial [Gemmataceae bacterium]|nr:hypothetical protein [Gemmataceae bacterium]
AVGCAFRSGGVAPEFRRSQPPAADGIPATLGPTPTTVPVAAAAATAPVAAVAPPLAAVPARPNLRVYVIDGADPFGFANTRGLADRLRGAGYPDTHYAGWLRAGRVEREIRAAHAADPAARFALVGYSTGAVAARNVANRLVRDGVPVALVGYVGGDYFSDSAATRAAGVGRVVNVTGSGHPLTGRNLFFNGTDITGARNLRLDGTGHFSLPQHPATLATLEAELAAVGE